MKMLSTVSYKSAKSFLVSSALGGGFLLVSIVPVEAAHFQWSFSNLVGGIEGTVSGTLEVPEGNSVSATSVVLKSTTNPLFDSLIGLDFVTLPNFSNLFDVTDKTITAAYFGTDFFNSNINLNLQLNGEEYDTGEAPTLLITPPHKSVFG